MTGDELFLELVAEVAPDEIDLAGPMYSRHRSGRLRSSGAGPAAAGFGPGDLLLVPTLLAALTSIAPLVLPLLRKLVEVGAPSIGAAADVVAMRQALRSADRPGVGIDGAELERIAAVIEDQLRAGGVDAAKRNEITLACLRRLLAQPAPAAQLVQSVQRP